MSDTINYKGLENVFAYIIIIIFIFIIIILLAMFL